MMTQSASSISGNDRDDALPWSLIGTGLAAMAALYCTRGRFNGLIILAVALIASRLTSWRLPRARSISWGVRLVILAVVLVLFRGHSTNYSPVWYLNEDDTRVAGIAVAAELVLRAWERHAPGRARQSRGLAILGTFLIFLAATHTYEREAIQWVTPVYMIFMLLALRSFAWMGQPPNAVRAVRPGLAAMRVIVLLFSLGIGFGATSLVTRYEPQISSWSTQIMKVKQSQSAEIGFSMDARLGTVSNPRPTMDRILLIDGPQTEQHLRVMAFDTYASPTWLPAMSDRTYRPAVLGNAARPGAARHMRITRVADVADLLPVPLESQKIEAQGPLEEERAGHAAR